MLVLHGFWSMSGSLRLWAEDSDLLVKSPSQALRSARPHPFAAAADAIAGIHPGKPGTSVLLLPSLRSAPLDSPELIRVIPRPAARTDATLLAWTVPVVQLDAGAALAAIDEPVANIRYGASVGYLAELAAFARELVERGRVAAGAAARHTRRDRVLASGVAGSRRGRDDLTHLGDAAGVPGRTWRARPARAGGVGVGRDGRCRRARGVAADRPAAPAPGAPEASARRGGLVDGADRSGRPVRRGTR